MDRAAAWKPDWKPDPIFLLTWERASMIEGDRPAAGDEELPLPPASALTLGTGDDHVGCLAPVITVSVVLGALATVAIASVPFVGGRPVDELPPLFILLTSAIDGAVTIGACWIFACVLRSRTLRDGLALHRVPRRTLWTSVALGAWLAVGGTIVATFFTAGTSAMARLAETVTGLLVITVLGLALPVAEELYYRRLILSGLQHAGEILLSWTGVTGGLARSLSAGVAIVLSTGWFVVPHSFQLLGGDAAGLIPIAVVGLSCAWLTWHHRSLVPALALHLTYNATLLTTGWIGFALKG